MQYRQKSLFWPNFDDSQPSIAKMAKRITIFIRFQMFYFSFSIFHISSSNQDENNGVSYIQIGSQTKKMIFSSNLLATAVSRPKGQKGKFTETRNSKKSIGHFYKVILPDFKQK